MKQEPKNAKSKDNDALFSTTDKVILAITIVLCMGLEVASVLPVVEDKIYDAKYNKLIEQGHTEWCATINAEAQTEAARTSLFLAGLGAGLIGMGAMRIKKSIEFKRAIKEIENGR